MNLSISQEMSESMNISLKESMNEIMKHNCVQYMIMYRWKKKMSTDIIPLQQLMHKCLEDNIIQFCPWCLDRRILLRISCTAFDYQSCSIH